jgi:hypothetical protein
MIKENIEISKWDSGGLSVDEEKGIKVTHET